MCDHTKDGYEEVLLEDDDGEYTRYYPVKVSAMEDIDTGRMKCTICGAIEYYTGQWKDFWEKGIPCLGSDKFKREKG